MPGREEADGRERKARDARSERSATPGDYERDPAPCDVCGIHALVWRRCKLVCENCGAINKSCADL